MPPGVRQKTFGGHITNEERFQALKASFFVITFTDGVIQMEVLESVQEYLE